MTMQDALSEIRSSISRGKGTFALTLSPPGQGKPFNLAVGSIRAICEAQGATRAVQIPGGFIVTLGLSRDQVAKLREMCDELLKANLAEESSS